MQPFLSGETTLAILLTVLTLLFFAAAGDEHPYEPYHHHSLPVEAGRSSLVDLSHEQPQQIKGQELIVRLNGLQTHGSGGGDQQSVPAEEHQRRSSEVTVVGRPRGAISFQAKPPRLSTTSTSPFIPTSRLLRPPRNLQILVAALLSHSRSHRSHHHRRRRGSLLLHTTATPFSTVFKSGAAADMSTWLLEALLGLLLLGMGLPTSMVATTTRKTTSSLRCPTTKRSKRRKSVRFVGVGGGEEETGELQRIQSGLELRSVVEAVC